MASKYKKLKNHEAILNAPEMYIGSVRREPRKEWHCIEIGGEICFVLLKTDIPIGLIHIFKEMTSNVADNCTKSRDAGVDPGKCEITVKKGMARIKSYGLPIPIKINKEYGEMVPKYIFSDLHSGSSFTSKRTGGGRHGLGGKAANIMSKEYNILCKNSGMGRSYSMTWYDNLTREGEEILDKKYDDYEDSVQITYHLDMERFGYEAGSHYTEEMIQILKWVSACLSFTAKIPVVFNGETMNFADIKKFGLLYVRGTYFKGNTLQVTEADSEDEQTSSKKKITKKGKQNNDESDNRQNTPKKRGRPKKIVKKDDDKQDSNENDNIHDIFDKNDNKEDNKEDNKGGDKDDDKGIELSKETKITLGKYIIHKEQGLELIAIDAPNKGIQIGFTNSIINSSGGTHVNGSLHALTGNILGDKKSSTKESLTIRDIKNHIILIVNLMELENPEWGNGQTKTKLTGPQIKPQIDDAVVDKLKKWSLAKMLEASIQAKKVEKMLKGTEGKVRRIREIKGEDANWAGHPKKWINTILRFVEGDSASQYESEALNHLYGGRNLNGVLELRGKVKNVMKSSEIRSLKNKEIFEIIKRLNAKPRTDYTIDKNFNTLRYGRAEFMTDPDLDGSHIGGLLLALFYEFFPTLLQRNDYIYVWFIPIIHVSKGEPGRKGYKLLRFYTRKEYNEWAKKTPDYEEWKHRYFKGLGSCTPEDIKMDCEEPKEVLLEYKPSDAAKIKLAFGKLEQESKHLRKDWMNDWDPEARDYLGEDALGISQFIDWYVREYSNDTLVRNLPDLFAGQTRIQRKITYSMFKEFGRQCQSKKTVKIEPNFAGKTGERTAYHQGNSIPGSVICMAQNFVGCGNNIALMSGKGSFGSIQKGGKDSAAPRYLEVSCRHITALLFRKEDDKCLTYMKDDGKPIEPAFYLPILPLVAINGARGVAMGWSSEIPSYHPLEVLKCIEDLLAGKEIGELIPWYRDYQGTIVMEDGYMISTGKIVKAQDDKCTVVCLPVGMWNKKYLKFLNNLIDEGHLKSFKSHCTATKTCFELKGINFDLKYEKILASETRKRKKDNNHTKQDNDGEKKQNDIIQEEQNDIVEEENKDTIEEKKDIIEEKKNNTKKPAAAASSAGANRRGRKGNNVNEKEKRERKDDGEIPAEKIHIGSRRKEKYTLEDIGLVHRKKMTNMTIINSDGKVITYKNISDLIKAYYEARLPYYQKRKDILLADIQKEIDLLEQRKQFIQAILNGKLKIKPDDGEKLSEKEVLKNIAMLKLNPIFYTKPKKEKKDDGDDENNDEEDKEIKVITKIVNIRETNDDRIEELNNKIIKSKEKYAELMKVEIKNMWLSDLADFKKEYIKLYGKDTKMI
jgi:DNA topoisomerase-2